MRFCAATHAGERHDRTRRLRLRAWSRALYVQLGGGTPLCEQTVGGPQRPLSALAAEHFEGLVALLSQFRTESTPYASRPFPQFASRFGTFDHLARVKEWSAAGLDSGDAE